MPKDRFSSAGQIALRYRERAAEMRRQAIGAANEELRYILLDGAKLYEALAEQAERKSRAADKKSQFATNDNAAPSAVEPLDAQPSLPDEPSPRLLSLNGSALVFRRLLGLARLKLPILFR